jgi:biopolymer transport protein ExbD
MTSSLSERKSTEEVPIIALGPDGAIYQVLSRDTYSGETVYQPVVDLPAHLEYLRSSRGTGVQLEIAADRGVPVKRVIEVFDMCQLRGFMRTRVRLGSNPDENPAEQP